MGKKQAGFITSHFRYLDLRQPLHTAPCICFVRHNPYYLFQTLLPLGGLAYLNKYISNLDEPDLKIPVRESDMQFWRRKLRLAEHKQGVYSQHQLVSGTLFHMTKEIFNSTKSISVLLASVPAPE